MNISVQLFDQDYPRILLSSI